MQGLRQRGIETINTFEWKILREKMIVNMINGSADKYEIKCNEDSNGSLASRGKKVVLFLVFVSVDS